MGMKNYALGAFASTLAAVARAAPQRGIVPTFPIRNATRTAPGPTGSSCEAKCSVVYPEISAISWVPEYQIVYTTKITVATVSVIIVTSENLTVSTRTDTVYNDVPTEYSLYAQTTDKAGTAMVEVTVTLPEGRSISNLAYPTPYLDYATEYSWSGVLPTTKERDSVCGTAIDEPATAILPQHLEYPQPKEGPAPSEDDPFGAEHKPLWVPVDVQPDKLYFDIGFPSESAFSYCESVPRTAPAIPTLFSAPKFVYVSTTITTQRDTPGVIVVQPTATGWEETTPTDAKTIAVSEPSQAPHFESTTDGWGEVWPIETATATGPNAQPAFPHFQSTATGFEEPPAAHQTDNEERPGSSIRTPNLPDAIISIINNNPSIFAPDKPQAQPAVATTPAPALTVPTPVFTFVPTVIDGQTTTIPAFILPGSSATATIGQTVTINGQPTVLAAPAAVFNLVPTTLNGVETLAPEYIISGTSTASIGQVVTLDGQVTTLAAPPPILTMVPTTINGIPTSILAYIISGSITATLGQTATIDGQTTVLLAPDAVYTMITTTIHGVPTTIPGYIISGSITATIGQTVTIDGTRTVLSTPTGTDGVDTWFGGPASTTAGQGPQATGATQGVGVLSYGISWSAALAGVVAGIIVLL